MPKMAVLTLMRSFIGFIFKISYKLNSLSLSVGLASRKLLVMVSAGFRVDVPCGLQASFRDGVPDGSRAAEMVWKTCACGKRVAGQGGRNGLENLCVREKSGWDIPPPACTCGLSGTN